jgi:urease accessory protein
MLNVSKLLPQGQGLSPVLLKRASEVTLDWDTRQKSRFDATDSLGRPLAVFLPRGKVVRGGDVLVAEDGSMVRVVAEPQAVMAVRTCPDHGSPVDLVRAAYHLGNRHVALQVGADRLQFEPDPVLADMLRRMHLIVSEEQAAFEPEGGAYEAAAAHGHAAHDGGHDHDHAGHDHAAHSHDVHAHEGHADTPRPVIAIRAHDQGQAHDPAPHVHVHGPGCQHDH